MAQKKTYTIVAFNHRLQMNATVNYYPYTSKRAAIDIAEKMIQTGARNVKVICDQTNKAIFKQAD